MAVGPWLSRMRMCEFTHVLLFGIDVGVISLRAPPARARGGGQFCARFQVEMTRESTCVPGSGCRTCARLVCQTRFASFAQTSAQTWEPLLKQLRMKFWSVNRNSLWMPDMPRCARLSLECEQEITRPWFMPHAPHMDIYKAMFEAGLARREEGEDEKLVHLACPSEKRTTGGSPSCSPSLQAGSQRDWHPDQYLEETLSSSASSPPFPRFPRPCPSFPLPAHANWRASQAGSLLVVPTYTAGGGARDFTAEIRLGSKSQTQRQTNQTDRNFITDDPALKCRESLASPPMGRAWISYKTSEQSPR